MKCLNDSFFLEIYESTYTLPQRPTGKDGHNSQQFYANLNIQEVHNVYGPQNNQEPFYHVLEKPTTDGEAPLQQFGVNSLELPVYNILEELSTKEGPANYVTEPAYNVLEDPNLVVAKGPGQYGARTLEGPIYNTLEEPYSDDPYRANCQSERTNEPVHNVLEEGLFRAIDKYGSTVLQEPVHNVREEGPERPENHVSEPVYNVLEDPNLERTHGHDHYGAMSSEGPIYNTLEEPNSDDPYEASCNLKYKNEPIYNALEDETYGGTSVAAKHGAIDLQDPVYNVLERP